jgi:GPH family glycoside/pentoside/hexuronide:cation symporter
MLVQGALLFLVAHFGNINPDIQVDKLNDTKYEVTVSTTKDVEKVNIKTDNGIALFSWTDTLMVEDSIPTTSKSFSMVADKPYVFIVEGEENISQADISIIDQSRGYSYSIYVMSIVLAIALFLTFLSTKERISPPKKQKSNLGKDFKDLITNRPWIILLIIGLVFQTYNSIKQGITVIYFTHYVHNQILAASYMVALMFASIAGAMITTPLAKKWGKRMLLIWAFIFSGVVNAMIYFCGPQNLTGIFTLGILSEFGAAIMPTLFFAMLGDAADYSEYKHGRRATGLIYSAGSFSTKFGGGIAGAIIGMILAAFNYNGMDTQTIPGAIPGIVMLMSWVPTIIAMLGAVTMLFYPLSQKKMDEITIELNGRRQTESQTA